MGHSLSSRQLEVLRLAAQGLTDKEIALRLGISPNTISSHWKKLRAHFGATSRTEVVARVLADDADTARQSQDDEKNRLLYEIAERDRVEARLREVVQQLEEVVQSRNSLISETMIKYEAQQNATMKRLRELEELNRVVREFGCIPNEGCHGTSWQKTWVSESMESFGYTVDEVVSGEVSVFNTIHPEDLPDSMEECAKATASGGNILLSHRFVCRDGSVRVLLDFLKLHPVDASGVGRATGMAIDVTEWVDAFKAKIARGWPDLPLRDSKSEYPPNG